MQRLTVPLWDQSTTWQIIGRAAQNAGADARPFRFAPPSRWHDAFAPAKLGDLESAIRLCASIAGRTDEHRSETDRKSGQVTAGLMLLLGLCGWIVDGEAGATRALATGLCGKRPECPTHRDICERFDARLLHAIEMPAVFDALRTMCRRAGMTYVPEVYVLSREVTMNAYALGQRDHAVIVVTEGLLRGMTPDEVAAILAHEIAHIRNDDGWAMTQATNLRLAVNHIAASLSWWSAGAKGRSEAPNLVWLVRSAPAIAELLCLGLSRLREFAADALALQLVQDGSALTSALEKLEAHHRGAHAMPMAYADDGLSSYLRSHPETWARVGELRAKHCHAR